MLIIHLIVLNIYFFNFIKAHYHAKFSKLSGIVSMPPNPKPYIKSDIVFSISPNNDKIFGSPIHSILIFLLINYLVFKYF